MKKEKKKSTIRRLFSRRILILIQLFVLAIFLFLVYMLKMLPTRYFMMLAGILILLWLGIGIWMKRALKRKRLIGKGGKLFFSKFVNVCLTIVLVLGCVYIIRGDDFLSNITNAFKQTHVISVYVLKDSKVKSLDDLKEGTFGINYHYESTNMALAMSHIEEEMKESPVIEEYADFTSLTDDFYNGKIDCLVASRSSMSNLEANHENFEYETREVYTYSIEETIEFSTKPTEVTEKPFTIYITGIDIEGEVSTVSRTDVNLLVTVNPKTKQILMVSIPRDTQINLAMNGKMDKLTHTGDYGINETIETISNFLDVDINYYAKTNFTGIVKIIDALGGVDIESPYPTFTTLHGNYTIEPGMHHFDGIEALCFVRERYSLPMGDFDRGKNQQRLLTAMIKKAMSAKIITNYNEILNAVEDSFETDLTSDDIKSLIHMQLDDMATWQIFQVQVSGEDDYTTKTYSMMGSNCYIMIPDKQAVKEIKKVIDKITDGKKLSDKDVEGLSND